MSKVYEMMIYESIGDCWVPDGGTTLVGGSAETVMNSSVTDTECYYDATDVVNGSKN